MCSTVDHAHGLTTAIFSSRSCNSKHLPILSSRDDDDPLNGSDHRCPLLTTAHSSLNSTTHLHPTDLSSPNSPSSMAAPPRHSTMMSISNTAGTPQSGSSDKPPTPQPAPTPQPTPGLRVPSNRKTIYDRHLNRSRNAELSRASFAYLFAEMVTYAQRRVTGIQDLEKR